ncbi:MAG: hypothetical protein FD125_1404 [bacterium]|nr:MAG: hypothetical protein FD125_1404 [bacterium]
MAQVSTPRRALLISLPLAAQGVVLKSVAGVEPKQEQRAFGPSAEGRRTGGGHEHHRVDLEAPVAEVAEGHLDREDAAEAVGPRIQDDGQPGRDAGSGLLRPEAQGPSATARQGECDLPVRS